MRKSILVGVAYFGCVFAAASVLGVLRTVLVVAVVGETVAVALDHSCARLDHMSLA
jgi:hypothetical protein